jgi:chromosome partitioning protein
VPRSIRLSEAPGFGKSIFQYDKNSIGAQKYNELAKELLGQSASRIEPVIQEEGATSP